MKLAAFRILAPFLSLLLLGGSLGCKKDPDGDDDTAPPDWDEIEPAQLSAGTADSTLKLPVGVPLTGYTGRCSLFGGTDSADGRDSSYAMAFDPSMGVHTAMPVRVVWLEAGDQVAVLVKADLVYAFDGLVVGLEQAISEATGVDVTDRVFLFTGHSHQSWGDFSQAHFLFLGHDRYQVEIFDRIVMQTTDLAVEARASSQPAAIGIGLDPQFDPDDEIFHSRRDDHLGLVDDWGVTVEDGYKDPNLYMVRIDASQGTPDPGDDDPMAILFGFGIHGTIMGENNAMASTESSGAIELKLENLFEDPLTLMHFQVNGGDMSASGVQDDFARMESVGEIAAERIKAFWETVETSTDPIRLEGLVRTVYLGRDMRVTRDGAVDLHYLEYDEDYEPDLIVYGEDGLSVNPYDEFIAPYGAGLCGDTSIDLSFVGMGVDVFPYNSCADAELVAALIEISFHMDEFYELEMPLIESTSTMIGALALDAVPVTVAGEGTSTQNVVFGFIPGEPTTMLGRSYQKRMLDRHGVETSIVVGFAMDHEGYIMAVEDWMRGGYEAQINIWGPLEGEYIIDQLIELSELATTSVAEDASWPEYQDQMYPEWNQDAVPPDAAPGCGTVPETIYEYLWTRDSWKPQAAQPDATIPRVSGMAHFLFYGGDPAIDLPVVTLQVEQTPGTEDWTDVLLPNGLPLTDRGYDMMLSYTPDPLVEPYEGQDRHHNWLVEWQAVTDRPDMDSMAGMPAGRYRFSAAGLCTDPADTEFPFGGVPYEVVSDPFEVTGTDALSVSLTTQTGTSVELSAAYLASARGFRLLHLDSHYRTTTPLVGGLGSPVVTARLFPEGGGDALVEITDIPATASGDASLVQVDLAGQSAGNYQLQLSDLFGNTGAVAITLP